MPASIDAGAATRTSGAMQARADRVLRIALIGVVSGVGLGFTAAFLVPLLTALDVARTEVVRLFAIVLGAAITLAVALLGPSGEPPGARLALRVGTIVTATGTFVSLCGGALALILAAPLGVPFERSSVAALTAGGIGVSLVGAMIAGLVTSSWRRGTSAPSSGVPLRLLVSSATGTLTLATWALATAYLIGHLHVATRQTAVDEARDLVAVLEGLPAAELERLAGELAPPGGFVGRIDTSGAVVPGLGAGLSRDARIVVDEGPPTLCRVVGQNARPLPCATGPLEDGTRVIAAVSAVPLQLSVLVGFALVGIAAGGLAFAIGRTLGRGPADDLDRIAAVLDELAHASQGGLDRPIPAVSLDEVGDLSVALARLRVRLRPGLVEHDEALVRARAADHERDEFLALVSEELRAPLDRILGAARLLLEGHEPLTPAQREDIRLIVSSSTHLTELIEEVLDLSAIATGQIRLRTGEVDLAQLATDVARAQRPLLGARKVELKLDVAATPARIIADERRLRQVLTNLVSNAVKFTVEGSITIAVAGAADAATLVVSDTGPGIASEQLPRLFSDFVQLGSLRQRARGTGLGLAICKRLIDAHGGSIAVTSELGVGTRFTVRLPRSPALTSGKA